jgi:hypothetical protein
MSSPSGLIQSGLWPYLTPVLLLFCSNLFMTFAWCGHLKFKSVPLVIDQLGALPSWKILLRGAGESDRQRGLFTRRAEDDPGGCHPLIVFAGFTALYFDGCRA